MTARAMLLTACCLASACAGPVRTRYGSLPTPGPPAQSPTLRYLPLDAAPLSTLALASTTDDEARRAVTEALRASGIGIDDQSANELHIGLSSRPDRVGVLGAGGTALASPRRQRLLQNCRNSGYRLTLAVTDRHSGEIVARGWAEESHCAADLTSVLPVLARQSVAMLTRPGTSGSTLRWTRD
ncbi:hypothetical protein LWE61_11620 [Sphingobium sufflavum]|uniref:hypothetical protein n=1 Tax=Sphingobium sufflavum TaxID=1129547 RepID=UPI001F264735|nr:hypothetical protein [Sphingobium sufflavum]MCE7797207.1 hypothetical protein [Sphingobium sufflavum]